MSGEDAGRAMREASAAMIFGQLATMPELVGVTLRREVCGRWWDIAIRRVYRTLPDALDRPRRVAIYAWRAAPAPLDDEADAPPAPVTCPRRFGTAAAALADAAGQLAQGSA